MATITISRQFGAGGQTLGRRLAKTLGYHCVDEIVVREIAKEIKVSTDQVRAFEKDGGANLMKFIDKFVSGDYINRLISGKYGYVDEKNYVEAVRTIIREVHRQGNVVIIGRGGQYILRDEKDVYHVLLVSNLEDRIRFIKEKYNLKDSAEKAVQRADKNRAGFLSFFSNNGNHDDPLLYDLTINTKKVSIEKAEALIIRLISE